MVYSLLQRYLEEKLKLQKKEENSEGLFYLKKDHLY